MEADEGKLPLIIELIKKHSGPQKNLGLLNGKLGLSIFLYKLSKAYHNEEYLALADGIIGDIFDQIGSIQVSYDFEDGLSGIAFGLSYLVKNDFVEADLDELLSQVDDKIYKGLIENFDFIPVDLKKGYLGYLFYFLYRLEGSHVSEDVSTNYVFKSICIKLINRISKLLEEDKLQLKEPLLFTVLWDLPVLLILLEKAHRLSLCISKIERMLEYISSSVLSLYPTLQSNRLFLLLGLESVLNQISIPKWRDHANFLRRGIDTSVIINDELKNLNIFIADGVCGLFLISNQLFRIISDQHLLISADSVLSKIEQSEFWGDSEFYKIGKENIGVLTGLSGVGLILTDLISMNKTI